MLMLSIVNSSGAMQKWLPFNRIKDEEGCVEDDNLVMKKCWQCSRGELCSRRSCRMTNSRAVTADLGKQKHAATVQQVGYDVTVQYCHNIPGLLPSTILLSL